MKRIVYLSTIVVHGQNPPPGTDESSPILTDHPFEYNNSKVRAERRFLALRAGGETELVVLRPGFVFGPRDRWVTNIVRGILNRSAYIVKGAGICNTIYVDNLAHAIELAMTADVDGEVFNITDRETVTWRELHEMASAAMGSDWEVPEIVKPRTVREHVAVIDRLKRVRAVSRLLPHVPRAWKLGAREVLGLPLAVRQSLAERRQARLRTPWVLDAPTTPSVPVATVLAHSCAWKLPLDKAVGRLGYAPEVSVEEGMRRTLAWLEFSGYPMAADTAG